jgi:hypothetical protein
LTAAVCVLPKYGFIHLEKSKNGERRDVPINKTLALTLNGIFDNTQEKLGRIDLPVFNNPVTEKAYEDVDRAFAWF